MSLENNRVHFALIQWSNMKAKGLLPYLSLHQLKYGYLLVISNYYFKVAQNSRMVQPGYVLLYLHMNKKCVEQMDYFLKYLAVQIYYVSCVRFD